MFQNISQRKQKAFTLIEVLVVVAIIALLVAILLPSLAKARAQARTAVCQSNARQHATAANLFAVESKGLIPRGGNVDTVHWTQVVLKSLGNKLNTRVNPGKVNRVPVESFEVFQCPERRGLTGDQFLDYVVNALDHRGPVDPSNGCTRSNSGSWHEVRLAKLELWRRPSEVAYIVDAATYEENKVGYLESAAKHLDWLRNFNFGTPPQTFPDGSPYAGIDFFDMFTGGQVPMREGTQFNNETTSGGSPRAAFDMHGNRGIVASYPDAHVDMIRPPSEVIAPNKLSIRQYYWREFGIEDPQSITNATSISPGGSTCNLGLDKYSG